MGETRRVRQPQGLGDVGHEEQRPLGRPLSGATLEHVRQGPRGASPVDEDHTLILHPHVVDDGQNRVLEGRHSVGARRDEVTVPHARCDRRHQDVDSAVEVNVVARRQAGPPVSRPSAFHEAVTPQDQGAIVATDLSHPSP